MWGGRGGANGLGGEGEGRFGSRALQCVPNAQGIGRLAKGTTEAYRRLRVGIVGRRVWGGRWAVGWGGGEESGWRVDLGAPCSVYPHSEHRFPAPSLKEGCRKTQCLGVCTVPRVLVD